MSKNENDDVLEETKPEDKEEVTVNEQEMDREQPREPTIKTNLNQSDKAINNDGTENDDDDNDDDDDEQTKQSEDKPKSEEDDNPFINDSIVITEEEQDEEDEDQDLDESFGDFEVDNKSNNEQEMDHNMDNLFVNSNDENVVKEVAITPQQIPEINDKDQVEQDTNDNDANNEEIAEPLAIEQEQKSPENENENNIKEDNEENDFSVTDSDIEQNGERITSTECKYLHRDGKCADKPTK